MVMASPWAASSTPQEGRLPYHFPASRTIEVDSKKLGLCLAKESIRDFSHLSYSRNKHILPITGGDDFRSYLENGENDWFSGNESTLKNWILSQPANSIDPIALYRKSLELNGGDIFETLVTCYTLLRENARWWITAFYNYDSSYPKEQAFFDKFIDIRGDLRERGAGFHGDHPGSWYRIWGAMLYRAYLNNSFQHAVDLSACNQTEPDDTPFGNFKREMGDLHAWLAYFQTDDPWKPDQDGEGKLALDLAASSSIDWMAKGLRDHSLLDEVSLRECENRSYLK